MAIILKSKRAASLVPVTEDAEAWSTPWPVLLLTCGERQRSRLAAMLPDGRAVAVILPRGDTMQHGDILCGEAGERVEVRAGDEELLCIRAASPLQFVRIVYHLANRHVRAMLREDAVFIEPDPVLADMVAHLGGRVERVLEAFIPEGGAYAGGHAGQPGHGGHHHHHHADECSDVVRDEAMGALGEQLSIAAHARKTS